MKVLTAALLATAFIASPALACGFGKTADHGIKTTASSTYMPDADEAMSTFDPATKPVFEEASEAAEEMVDDDEAVSE